MDNILNFVKYTHDRNLLLVHTLYYTAQKQMSHILEYLKYYEQDNKYNYIRYYKVLPKLLQRPNTGIATERMYSSIINRAVWKILMM